MFRTTWLICGACAASLALAACGDDGSGAPGGQGFQRIAPPPLAPALAGSGGQWFEDVTRAWGITHEKSPGDAGALNYQAASVCVIDVDGVPPLDLFFVRRGVDDDGSVLYVGQGYGDYADETDARGLGDVGDALGCLAFDADGDADEDLLVVGTGLVALYENDGGTFDDEGWTIEANYGDRYMFISSAAGDFDGDGDLDVAIGGYVDFDEMWKPESGVCRVGIPCEHDPGFYANIPNLLLINEPTSRLLRDEAQLRSPAMGGIAQPQPTLAMGAVDVDVDGVLEIFVGNDFRTPDEVWWRGNASEVFFNMFDRFGIGLTYRGFSHDTMGWSTGDVDGDGYEDHVITGFEDDPTSVHVSRGDEFFEDEAPIIGMRAREDTFRWGAALADFDLDGDVDLAEATGHFYLEAYFGPGNYDGPESQPTNFFENVGGTFEAVDPVPGDGLATPGNSRGIAVADLDDDGRPDLILGDCCGPPQVLRNVAPRDGHWLRIRLAGDDRNPLGVGARVEVTVPGRDDPIVRHRKVGEGYGGNFDPRILLGVGDATTVDVRVRWIGGDVTTLEGVEVDQEITVEQPD